MLRNGAKRLQFRSKCWRYVSRNWFCLIFWCRLIFLEQEYVWQFAQLTIKYLLVLLVWCMSLLAKPTIISKQHALCKTVKFFAFCYLSEAFLCDEVQKEAFAPYLSPGFLCGYFVFFVSWASFCVTHDGPSNGATTHSLSGELNKNDVIQL